MKNFNSESGFSIAETLVAMVLLSFVGLAAVRNTIMSMVSLRHSLRNSVATQLAVEKLEELGAINPLNLDAADNTTEPTLAVDNMKFTRQVTVTMNADNSRTVQVVVSSNSSEASTSYTISNTFPLWGNT